MSRRLIAALVLSASMAAMGMLRAQAPDPLFDEVAVPTAVAMVRAASTPAARRRFLTVRVAELARLVNIPPGSIGRFRLNLFADADYEIAVTSITLTRPGALTITGRIEGLGDSLVILTTEAGVVTVLVQVPGSPTITFEVTPVDGGIHLVREVDQGALPVELPPIPVVSPDADRPSNAVSDTAATIDLLVLYTPAARASAGGTTGINTLVDGAAAATNAAYANSGVTQQVRVVHRAETPYVETDITQALTLLRGAGDGVMDEAHTLRNLHAADLVALIGNYSDYCGYANLMVNVSPGFASSGFSVTATNCAVGNLSFAHELGHNMGLHHDVANAGGQAAYNYSFGYRDPGFFRTVMSYDCGLQGLTPCPRVGHFSTPGRTFNGRVTGTVSTNNALTLNQTALTVANFRQVDGPPPSCSFTVAPTAVTAPAASASHVVQVTTIAGCPWFASTNTPWLTLGFGGAGSGEFTFVTAANAGLARTGTFTVAGQVVSVTQAAGVPTYFLAEGATNFFTLDVLIANPNTGAVPVAVTFLKPDGTTVLRDYTLLGTSRTTIRVDDIAGLENTPVSTIVTSITGAPLVVERTMTWDGGGYGGHGEAAVGGAATTWYFAEGSQGFFDAFVILANAGAASATVTLNFLTEFNGVIPHVVTVGPSSRHTIHAASVANGQLVGKSFSIVVISTQPITAERAMYFGTSPFWSGGHESAGATAPSTSWFHAEGATGDYFDTFILVGNPNAGAAQVTFSFLLESGATVTRAKTVPGNTRLTVNVEAEDVLLRNAAVSTTVTSTLPIISERSTYWAGAAGTWFEAHNSFGRTAAGTKWGLAEGRVGGAASHATYILLANPNATPANVRLTFLRANGQVVIATRTVNPTSRLNIDVGAEIGALANQEFATILESTNGVSFVVERSMYWNALGVTWAAGTNAAATRIP